MLLNLTTSVPEDMDDKKIYVQSLKYEGMLKAQDKKETLRDMFPPSFDNPVNVEDAVWKKTIGTKIALP